MSIAIVEHSSRYDLAVDDQKEYKEIIYKRIQIDEKGRERMKAAFPYGRDAGNYLFLACIFEPHHRIEIQRKDGSFFIYEICFSCGEHQLEMEQKRILPNGWEKALSIYFTSLSLQPDKEWRN